MHEYLAGKKPSTEQLNEWINFFHINGFLVIQNVLTPFEFQLLINDLDEVVRKIDGDNYQPSKKNMVKRIFEHSQHSLELFAQEPIVTCRTFNWRSKWTQLLKR